MVRHEKGGKEHSMLGHHHLETYLQDYIEAAGPSPSTAKIAFRESVFISDHHLFAVLRSCQHRRFWLE
jgi:hypothetical protein